MELGLEQDRGTTVVSPPLSSQVNVLLAWVSVPGVVWCFRALCVALKQLLGEAGLISCAGMRGIHGEEDEFSPSQWRETKPGQVTR